MKHCSSFLFLFFFGGAGVGRGVDFYLWFPVPQMIMLHRHLVKMRQKNLFLS